MYFSTMHMSIHTAHKSLVVSPFQWGVLEYAVSHQHILILLISLSFVLALILVS
jgi:hypothetical protein